MPQRTIPPTSLGQRTAGTQNGRAAMFQLNMGRLTLSVAGPGAPATGGAGTTGSAAPAARTGNTTNPPSPPAPGERQRPRTSLTTLLLLSFLLWMLSNRNSDEALARNHYLDELSVMVDQLSNYTAWLNGSETNYTLPERNPAVEPLIHSFLTFDGTLDPLHYSYYSNISGFFDGDVRLHNLTALTVTPWKTLGDHLVEKQNKTELVARLGTWDWNSTDEVTLVISDKVSPKGKNLVAEDVAFIHGSVELHDPLSSLDLVLRLQGVHYLNNGSLYGLALPNRINPDLRDVPSLVPEEHANFTARVIELELTTRIVKFVQMMDSGSYEDSPTTEEDPQTTCSFMFYGQIDPAWMPLQVLREIEAENQEPTGISTPPAPHMGIRGVLLSEDCGILYTINNIDGTSSKHWYRKVTTYAASTAIVYLALVILLSRQIALSRTPSGISSVSRWSFILQSVIDSICFAGHVTFSILAKGRASLSLFAPAFLAGILFVYEVQFALWIHQYQAPEDVPTIPTPTPAPRAQPPAATTPPAPAAAATPADTAAPVPQPTPATNGSTQNPSFIAGFIQFLRMDPQARTCILVAVLIIIMMHIVLVPSVGFLFTSLVYVSLWAPQIIRSARRGRPSGLTKEYLVGTTICRLAIATYFLTCPKNVLDVKPRPWFWITAVFMFVEIGLLGLQDVFGPSFFLPKSWAAAPTYDYHPPMPLPDPEAPERSLGDCAICMDAILLDSPSDKDSVDTASTSRTSGIFSAVNLGVGMRARKNYSLAPCHHLFHTNCLEQWLAIKNICPQCRRPLPPL